MATLINSLFPNAEEAAHILEALSDDREIVWQRLHQHGDTVPRQACTQGERMEHENGWKSYPLFRHPVDVLPYVLPFTPTVQKIRQQLEALPELRARNIRLNHVLIQRYRDGNDSIGAHSDKTLDLEPATYVVNASFGVTRDLVLREKRAKPMHDPSASSSSSLPHPPRPKRVFELSHNSAFLLDLVTNASHTHEIRQDPAATGGARISLTFRSIQTRVYYGRCPAGLYRQAICSGAGGMPPSLISKEAPLGQSQLTESRDHQRLLEAYGAENRSALPLDVEPFRDVAAFESSWSPHAPEDVIDMVITYFADLERRNICGRDHGVAHALAVMQNMQMAIRADLDRLQTKLSRWQLVLLVIVALYHDVDDRKIASQTGSTDNARRMLEIHLPTCDVEFVIASIATVSTSANGNTEPPDGEEWRALAHDADALEAVGQIGIDRCVEYAKRIGNPLHTPSTPRVTNVHELSTLLDLPARFTLYRSNGGQSASVIDHMYDKLLHLDSVHSKNPWLLAEARKRMEVIKNFVFATNRARA